jgi:hypothetical protein
LQFNEGSLSSADRSQVVPRLCNKQLLHVTLLRNPLLRTLSHSTISNMKYAWARNGTIATSFGDRTLTEKLDANPSVYDNYMVRVFLGKNAYASPSGALGQADLDAVLTTIANFDCVGVLEDRQGTQLLFQTILGWAGADLDQNALRKRKAKTVLNEEGAGIRSEDWDLLTQHSKLDMRVWQLGWLVHRIDLAIFEIGRVATTSAAALHTC